MTNYWWGWVFLMNVPVTALGLLAVLALVPESRSAERPQIDLVGTVLFCGGLAVTIYGMIEAGRDGWTSSRALIPVVAGVGILVALGFWERALS